MRTLPKRFNNIIKFCLMLMMLVNLWWLVQPALAVTTNDYQTFDNLQLISPHAQCINHITVTSNGDSGANTLRQALIDICDGGTIDFNATLAADTITTSSQLDINKTVTITNPNAPDLKISGNDAHRVFYVQSGTVVTMSNLNIISGTASGNRGGGILVDSDAHTTIRNCVLDGNSAVNGGGVRNYGTLTIYNSTLINNTSGLGGGGIYNSGVVTINSSTLSSNSTLYSYATGGGITNSNGGTLILNNCTLSNNSAYFGGGIFNINGSTVTVNNSTVSNNSANSGGGIRNEGTLNLRNTIIANSTNGGDCSSPFATITININNLIEDDSCNPAFSGDPNLGPLQDNGGSTLTHVLMSGSPAIDSGDNVTCLTTDQRGIDRPQDGDNNGTIICDIGAYELTGQPSINQAPYIPSNPIPLNSDGNISITQTLNWQGGDPDGDVVTYTIAFGSNNPPSIVGTTTLTNYTPSLISGTTYYWIITATDGISESISPLWSFTTEAAATIDTKYVYLPVIIK